MEHFINEKTVMKFYLEQMAEDKIAFLEGKDELKEDIKKCLENLIEEETMNKKIQIAVVLWKRLFEGAMSYISPNKMGYDKIFDYFDSYVEFEELIFASDSFYRDHTLHCLWVYFLGEYIARRDEFGILFRTHREASEAPTAFLEVTKELNLATPSEYVKMEKFFEDFTSTKKTSEAVRCISALTHDLGYPLKKIEKINKSIKKVLPYYAINNFNDFNFEYENIQQSFVEYFIDFISRNYSVHIEGDDILDEYEDRIFKVDEHDFFLSMNQEGIDSLTEEDLAKIRNTVHVNRSFTSHLGTLTAFANDFEEYQHGIMSAFLLMKNLRAFQQIPFDPSTSTLDQNVVRTIALQSILQSISFHTSEAFTITEISAVSFLTFVDELEEFSRISRASQNREYVEEFCDSAIYMEDGWFNVVFEFNNTNLDNLDPARAFKGRCKRFLTLFAINALDERLKIRVKVVGNLPSDQNTYVLEIAKNYANILVNGEEQNIPKYLKSSQFYTKEEYATL